MVPRGVDGSYSLPAGTLVQSGDTVLPSQHNPAMQDLGSSVGNSLSRDGLGGMRADLAMGGFDITNVGDINGVPLSGYALLAGATFTGTITAPLLEITGGGYYMNFLGANPRLNFDINDYIIYDRGANALSVVIGTTNRLVIQNAGNMEVDVPGSIRLRGSQVAYGSRDRIFVSDGTGAPSGGVNGDLYFQYA